MTRRGVAGRELRRRGWPGLRPPGGVGMVALLVALALGAGSGATVLGMRLAADSSPGSEESPSTGAGGDPGGTASGPQADPATQGPAGDQVAVVGQSKPVGELVAQVNGASLDRDIGGFPYVVVSVTLTNDSGRSQRVSPLVWWLESPDGRLHPSGPNDRPDALALGRLAPGESVSGTIAFDAPSGTYRVVYAPPGSGHRARVVWEVSA